MVIRGQKMWKTQNVLRETRRDSRRVFHSDPSAIRLLCAGAIRALSPKKRQCFSTNDRAGGAFFLTTAEKRIKQGCPLLRP